MAWKVERWLADVFPGQQNIYSEYRCLADRELAIVAVAVLDSALAEILTLRLGDRPKELEAFLGLNGDGRAPAASFGARIQLGLLLGVLSSQDAAVLRTMKDIRNEFAHRANAGFLSANVLKKTSRLLSLWMESSESRSGVGAQPACPKGLGLLAQYLPHCSEAGHGLLLAVFVVYHAYFHLMHSRILRVGPAIMFPESRDLGHS